MEGNKLKFELRELAILQSAHSQQNCHSSSIYRQVNANNANSLFWTFNKCFITSLTLTVTWQYINKLIFCKTTYTCVVLNFNFEQL